MNITPIKGSLSEEQYRELCRRAIQNLKNAYVPYSHFHVSAMLLCGDGSVVSGINIENASYTPTNCAERTAVFKAVSEGKREFRAIAVVGCPGAVLETEDCRERLLLPAYCPPCGVCRQVLREFADPESFEVILAKSPEEYRVYTLSQLLPESFGPENL